VTKKLVSFDTATGQLPSAVTAVLDAATAELIAAQAATDSSTYASSGGVAGEVSTGATTRQSIMRNRASVAYPVPIVRPVTAASPIAFDVAPSSGMVDAGSGIAWIDVCDDDPDDYTGTSFQSVRMRARGTYMEIGTQMFGTGGTTKPLYITINGATAMQILGDGTLSTAFYGPIVSTVTVVGSKEFYKFQNTNAGTTSFSQMTLKSNTGVLYLRVFSSTYAADSGFNAQATQINSTGPIILTTGANASINIVPGAGTKAARSAEFDSLGNVLLGKQAVIANAATDGFVHIPTVAGTPSGTPTLKTGLVPLVVDTTASKLWAYIGGAWKSVALA